MNKRGLLALIVIIVLIIIGYFALKSGPDATDEVPLEDEVVQEDADVLAGSGTYAIDTDVSELSWTGYKRLIIGYEDTGAIQIVDGIVSVEDGEVVSADVTIDMNSISVSSVRGGVFVGVEGLEADLKSERFFNVEEYPTAELVVTRVMPAEDTDTDFEYTATADLTMLGETHKVVFPARIFLSEEGDLRIVGTAEIDRTLYGITVLSGSFFEGLGENVVDDVFTVEFDIVASVVQVDTSNENLSADDEEATTSESSESATE